MDYVLQILQVGIVGVGACGTQYVTWPSGVGSRWGSLVCACFLALLIQVGLPDVEGDARCTLGVPCCLNCEQSRTALHLNVQPALVPLQVEQACMHFASPAPSPSDAVPHILAMSHSLNPSSPASMSCCFSEHGLHETTLHACISVAFQLYSFSGAALHMHRAPHLLC